VCALHLASVKSALHSTLFPYFRPLRSGSGHNLLFFSLLSPRNIQPTCTVFRTYTFKQSTLYIFTKASYIILVELNVNFTPLNYLFLQISEAQKSTDFASPVSSILLPSIVRQLPSRCINKCCSSVPLPHSVLTFVKHQAPLSSPHHTCMFNLHI